MTDQEVKDLSPGIYRVFLTSGEATLGAVGVDEEGRKWLATITSTGSSVEFGSLVREMKLLVTDRHPLPEKEHSSWRPDNASEEMRQHLLRDVSAVIGTATHLHSLNLRTRDQEMVLKDLASLIARLGMIVRDTLSRQ